MIYLSYIPLAVYRCRNYMSTVYILYFSTNFSLFLCLFLPFSVYRLLSGTEKDSAAYFFRGVSLFFSVSRRTTHHKAHRHGRHIRHHLSLSSPVDIRNGKKRNTDFPLPERCDRIKNKIKENEQHDSGISEKTRETL